ncbi:MAG TPA: hypothetical protein VG518_00580 [Solirubrobacterales bacterium]|nr:hypothetical protein [Solirubrobacterales bacterium]
MRRIAAPVALACLAALVASGCGNRYSGVSSRPAPAASEFPKASGTLTDLYARAGGESELVVLPTEKVFDRGSDRYAFGVFTAGNEQIGDAQVALYFAHGASGPARGPYPARIESLATKPAFISQTTGQDPAAAKVVYVTEGVPFDANGEWRVLALVKEGGGLKATLLPSAVVGHFPKATRGFPKSTANPPDVGEPAPRVHTPTPADVGGDLSRIDTRIPPDDMHEDLAAVLGRKPVALVFATPQFCQSRICGPVVDEQEQVKQRFGDRVAFIHMEIYNENNPAKGVRPQVKAFRLPSEPWLFVIDRHGIIRTRIEGAWGIPELEKALREALKR